MGFTEAIFILSILLIISVILSKISSKIAIPGLLIFIVIGILAGSDGILKIPFDNYIFAQNLGIIAISFILFMGGLGIKTKELKPVFKEGIVLSTFGVIITAIILAYLSYKFLNLDLNKAMLLGAIISSTDAAAVFNILRNKHISLKNNLKPLLEFESGSNDPMAIFLTLAAIAIIKGQLNTFSLCFILIRQMTIGIILGYLISKIFIYIINKIKPDYDGLYVVLTFGCVLFTYSIISLLNANGFIGVYVCGLYFAKNAFVNKKIITKFHDAIAWLFQIVLFLILGLLVDLKYSFAFAKSAFFAFLILTFIARPIATIPISLIFKRKINEALMIAWVGLRGAAPIVLATFPMNYNIIESREIFSIVFFIVIYSLIFQGTTIAKLSKILKVDAKLNPVLEDILEYREENTNNKLIAFTVKNGSIACNKKLFELNLPTEAIINLVYKKGEYIVPNPLIELNENDVVFILMNKEKEEDVRNIICKKKEGN